MAAVEADLANLSDAQQETLQQFLAITNSEPETAILLLQRSQWNVNVRLGDPS